MHDLEISTASLHHQLNILQILQETQKWLWDKGIEQWTLPFEAQWIAQSIEENEFFISTIDNDIVAVFRLVDTDPFIWADNSNEAIYIHSLAVQQSWRGQGIGVQILSWIESYAMQYRYRYIRLDCMAENNWLCQFYEQAGFVRKASKEIFNDDSIYMAALYEKTLVCL